MVGQLSLSGRPTKPATNGEEPQRERERNPREPWASCVSDGLVATALLADVCQTSDIRKPTRQNPTQLWGLGVSALEFGVVVGLGSYALGFRVPNRKFSLSL